VNTDVFIINGEGSVCGEEERGAEREGGRVREEEEEGMRRRRSEVP